MVFSSMTIYGLLKRVEVGMKTRIPFINYMCASSMLL